MWRNADVIMCHAYKLACLNCCCQLLPYFDGKLSLVRWWKNVHRVSTKQDGASNQVLCEIETQPSRNHCVLGTVLLEAAISSKSQSTPTNAQKRLFWAIFVAAMINLQQFAISEPDEVHHRSREPSYSATDSTSRDKQACTHYDVSFTSRLAKNINQQPNFVKIFWISIFSATIVKNFMYIDHHLSEL